MSTKKPSTLPKKSFPVIRPGGFNYMYYSGNRQNNANNINEPTISSSKRLRFKSLTRPILFVFAAILVLFVTFGRSDNKNAMSNAIDSKTATVINSPDSFSVVVNKKRPLSPIDYAPSDLVTPLVTLRLAGSDLEMHLRTKASKAIEQMFMAAAKDGIALRLDSAYRSYTKQTNLYNFYVTVQGKKTADEQSARPGFSEHQTGLAADIGTADGACDIQQCFSETPAGKWLAANAYQYGYILRYTSAKQIITGFGNEPWHYRFIGNDLALKLHQQHILTLEEFFHLPGAPKY